MAGQSSVPTAASRETSTQPCCSAHGNAWSLLRAMCSTARPGAPGISSTSATACCRAPTRTWSPDSPTSSSRRRWQPVSELASASMSGTAVILMAYGSPERVADVPAYYADIRGGRPISPENLEDLVGRYRALGIEDANPLNAITEATRAALEDELGLPVLTGMKHWEPRIADAVEGAVAGGASRLVGLVLAPHYSRLSIAGYRRLLDEALELHPEIGLVFVESWHDDPGLISFLADRVRDTDAHVVFTAHSLPARILKEGDPYKDQLLETARLVADTAGVEDWSFSFQSESPTGEPWLGPDILDHLTDLSARGVENILICPVGFVSDHLEIRWDIDTEAQDRARELGLHLERIEMPNDDPRFVRALADIVRGAAVLA